MTALIPIQIYEDILDLKLKPCMHVEGIFLMQKVMKMYECISCDECHCDGRHHG